MAIRTLGTSLVALLTIVALHANANDTIARVGAGGISFLQTDKIAMVQETLEISTKAVHVRYRFRNDTKQNIQATIAFPMPPYGWNPGLSAVDENIRPLESFKLHVNGQPVPTRLHRAAVIGARDVTAQLRGIGLSESQIFETFGGCNAKEAGVIECNLTKAQETAIANLRGINDRLIPWKVAETAYWDQMFPAGIDVEIEHQYPPFVGMAYSALLQGRYVDLEIPTASWEKNPKEACLDEGTRQAIIKRIRTHVKRGMLPVWVNLHDVEYILGTGRNWKGPIRDFKLVIRKDSPDQLVSLCFPGRPKRVDPLTIEFSHSNFTPQDKLVVYFYTVGKEVN